MSSVEAERRVAERARLEVMQERDALLKTLQEDGRKRQALGEQVEALEVSRHALGSKKSRLLAPGLLPHVSPSHCGPGLRVDCYFRWAVWQGALERQEFERKAAEAKAQKKLQDTQQVGHSSSYMIPYYIGRRRGIFII